MIEATGSLRGISFRLDGGVVTFTAPGQLGGPVSFPVRNITSIQFAEAKGGLLPKQGRITVKTTDPLQSLVGGHWMPFWLSQQAGVEAFKRALESAWRSAQGGGTP